MCYRSKCRRCKSIYSDLITKICSTAPGDDGKDLWKDFLYTIFEGDIELVGYVKKICGLVLKQHFVIRLLIYWFVIVMILLSLNISNTEFIYAQF